MTDNRTSLGSTSSQLESINDLTAQAVNLEEIYTRCAKSFPDVSLPREDFNAALVRAVVKYLVNFNRNARSPTSEEICSLVSELQAFDLYLTLACARGCEQAWWYFDRTYRPFIERLARRFVGRGMDASEIIDCVYVDLYGANTVNGIRQSKFRTYTGRGTLRGWLGTVISHTAVDLYRSRQNEVSLEQWTNSGEELGERREPRIREHLSEVLMLENVARERYRDATVAALDQSLAALDANETLLLLYYHVEGLKLREIARLADAPSSSIRRWFQKRGIREGKAVFRIHESTVMRWLARVYGRVAERFRDELKNKHGLNAAEIQICLEIATEDFGQGMGLNLDKSEITTLDQTEGAS